MRTLQERFWRRVEKSSSCWLWAGGIRGKGYGTVKVNGKQRSAHRVSYEMTFGEIPDGLFVLHDCDTPACVRPSHLFLGDHARNMVDRMKRGRIARGEDISGAKTTAADVLLIREEWDGLERGPSGRIQSGMLTQMAERWQLSKSTIRGIGKRQEWSWVT